MDLNETNYHVRCCDCVWHYSWDEKEDVMEETAKQLADDATDAADSADTMYDGDDIDDILAAISSLSQATYDLAGTAQDIAGVGVGGQSRLMELKREERKRRLADRRDRQERDDHELLPETDPAAGTGSFAQKAAEALKANVGTRDVADLEARRNQQAAAADVQWPAPNQQILVDGPNINADDLTADEQAPEPDEPSAQPRAARKLRGPSEGQLFRDKQDREAELGDEGGGVE